MNVILAADHAGFGLKEQVKVFLISQGHNVLDYGPYTYDPDDDYPDTINLAMNELQNGDADSRGIIFGGSGQGEAMCANRFAGIRATVYYGEMRGGDIIALSREHNNANVLSIGARFVEADEIKPVIERWLSLPFSNDERHIRRIQKF